MSEHPARILHLDVETAPAIVYTFQLRDINVSPEQIIEPGRIICWAAKWHGQRRMYFADERGGAEEMFIQIHGLMSDADATTGYNSDAFDLAKLNGAFVQYSLPPVPPSASIDLYKTARKFGYDSGKLAFVGPHLGIGDKVKHEGFRLWRLCLDGDEKAWKRMRRYNEQDVRLLELLYNRLRPYIRLHPYLGLPVAAKAAGEQCPRCQSVVTQLRGYRRTKAMLIQRVQCMGCGGWFDGKRSAVK